MGLVQHYFKKIYTTRNTLVPQESNLTITTLTVNRNTRQRETYSYSQEYSQACSDDDRILPEETITFERKDTKKYSFSYNNRRTLTNPKSTFTRIDVIMKTLDHSNQPPGSSTGPSSLLPLPDPNYLLPLPDSHSITEEPPPPSLVLENAANIEVIYLRQSQRKSIFRKPDPIEDIQKIEEVEVVEDLTLMTLIPVKKWFKNITGCSETDFETNIRNHIIDRGDGNLAIINTQTKQEFSAGYLKLIPLKALTYEVYLNRLDTKAKDLIVPDLKKKKLSKKKKEKVLKFFLRGFLGMSDNPVFLPITIRTRANLESDDRFVNVAHLQAIPENGDSVFQVASNFNGIESKTEMDKPTKKNFTKSYIADRTQGPAASISVGAAAIVRVHAAFYNQCEEWRQTELNYINFVSKISEHYPLKNGYVIFNPELPKFPAYNSTEYNKLLLSTDLLYHKDCQVTTGHRVTIENTDFFEVVSNPKQKVDQVLCAAVNMWQGKTGHDNKKTIGSEDKAKLVLDMSYQGTYLVAIKNQRTQIFLTLVGGGVFGNPIEWIIESIINAHTKWAISGVTSIQKITLVLWNAQHAELCSTLFRKASIPVIEEIE